MSSTKLLDSHKFKKGILAKNIKLKAIGIEMVFKATRMNKFTQGVRIDGEGQRTKE